MKYVDYMEVAPAALKQIRNGAFLTVQSHDIINTMTIGWASIGFLWGRPMMTVMVRNSRYTFELIEKSNEFTVSVPQTDKSAALNVCGSQSGREIDKFKVCNLDIFPGEKVKTPIIKTGGLHFECEIVYKNAINPNNLVEAYTHLYPEKDYHTNYYGEIKACYSTMDEE
jgi:flavin reductase (DIM6/NTAB) family NADH-FMN oxidoreductase RutF